MVENSGVCISLMTFQLSYLCTRLQIKALPKSILHRRQLRIWILQPWKNISVLCCDELS